MDERKFEWGTNDISLFIIGGYGDMRTIHFILGSIIFLVGLPPLNVSISYATLDRM